MSCVPSESEDNPRLSTFLKKPPKNVCRAPVNHLMSSTDLDKSSLSVNMSHPWICRLRRCDQLNWQPFNVTPHVTKHLEQRPLAKRRYWELASRINNKWVMRLRARLGARASLWFHLHLPVSLPQRAVLAGLVQVSRKALFNLPTSFSNSPQAVLSCRLIHCARLQLNTDTVTIAHNNSNSYWNKLCCQTSFHVR